MGGNGRLFQISIPVGKVTKFRCVWARQLVKSSSQTAPYYGILFFADKRGMRAVAKKIEPDFLEMVRGSYKFSHKNQVYAEEHFNILKNLDDKTFTFNSEIITPTVDESSLKIVSHYTVSHNYYPIQLTVEKYKGEFYSKETFTPTKNHRTRLQYIFESETARKEIKIQAPSHYHLATPAVCTALLFTKTKKYNPIISNTFYVITSENIWDYKRAPESRLVYLKCENIYEPEEVVIGDQALLGTRFNVFLDDGGKKKNKISYFISKHHAVPYQVIIDQDIQIDISNFENLGE